jgi:hypothetical protein
MENLYLNTIQKREKLNEVMRVGETGPGGAYHHYAIFVNEANPGAVEKEQMDTSLVDIEFQNGPRNEKDSVHGVIDTDLLEIVRDRLTCFQAGEFASEYNAQALLHVEEALMWLNRRVEDRIERNVLGTNNK